MTTPATIDTSPAPTVADLVAEIAAQRLTIQRLEKSERVQTALYAIADLASGPLDLPDMMQRIHGILDGLTYAKNLYIALYDEQRQTRRYLYYADENAYPLIDTSEEVPVSKLKNSLTMAVIRHARSAMGPSQRLLEEFGLPVDASFGPQSLDWLGVPLIADGAVRGAVVVQSYDAPQRYGEEDRTLLTFVAQHILTAIQRKQARLELEVCVQRRTRELADAVTELRNQISEREHAEQQLAYEALHDQLTALPNRVYFNEALERAIRRLKRGQEHQFAILFIDLDRFKVINDGISHRVGDEVLKEAARRIRSKVNEADLVARLGGDEFAVLLEQPQSPEGVCHLAQALVDTLSAPVHIPAEELFTSASIGIVFSHAHSRSAEQLLRDAEVAMYRAKAHGRHRFELFDEGLHRHALHLLEMEGDLRRALQRSEFEPHFQPIVRLHDGHVMGYEALLRWRHPQRGLLSPLDFLEVAEDSGLIEHMDWQLFEKTCRCIPLLGDTHTYVTINVSPQHFKAPDLASKILALLATHQLPAHRLRIELTEGALLDNPEQVLATLEQLRQAGVLAVLDDFGTGYSSLSYLHRFPLHTLKIDRSFVTPLHHSAGDRRTAIVRAVIALAKAMHLGVVAEGIETPNQRDCLAGMGCEHGQGFLYSPAQPITTWTKEAPADTSSDDASPT